MAAALILLTIILCLTLDIIARSRRARRSEALAGHAGGAAPRDHLRQLVPAVPAPDALLHTPVGTFLSPGHTWLQVEPAGIARVGVGRLPVKLLGQVDCLRLLPRGAQVKRGEELATLSHGVRELRLRAPVTGTITMVNRVVARDPARLLQDPFGKQWLYRIQPQNLGASLKCCKSADAATKWLRNELRRLRDFLSSYPSDLVPGVSLTDGGLAIEGAASVLGADRWARLVEEFFTVEPAETIRPRA